MFYFSLNSVPKSSPPNLMLLMAVWWIAKRKYWMEKDLWFWFKDVDNCECRSRATSGVL